LSPLEGVVSNACRGDVGRISRGGRDSGNCLSCRNFAQNGRDREHFRGVPVSKRIGGVGPRSLKRSSATLALGGSLLYRRFLPASGCKRQRTICHLRPGGRRLNCTETSPWAILPAR